ncbi:MULTISPECIES: hypothetical protein [unclassified Rhizobium]|uniref:hypothetical protein n=1 Tax=unclassified Rhizobium TaxID=2613769 RepID=UPI000714601B|nr:MULTISPECIES: hypothetical protein [unclassified Rhizobium]KQS99159.1 hypothetical protein ASG50_20885 [Rhizobium sp. Leaf386]
MRLLFICEAHFPHAITDRRFHCDGKMLALGFFSILNFRKGKELGPVGFGPPGAPSKNPATADKAEKKKRGTRTVRDGNLPAGNVFDDRGANVRHGMCITVEKTKGKADVKKAPAKASAYGSASGQTKTAQAISACDVTIRETRP